MEEKKGLKNKIVEGIKNHRWLIIMCGAALLLIITILSIPVNDGKSVLSSIIKNEEVKVSKNNFSIISVDKKSKGNYIDNNDRRSIPHSYFKEKGYLLEYGYTPRLDYMKVIERIYGGKNG